MAVKASKSTGKLRIQEEEELFSDTCFYIGTPSSSKSNLLLTKWCVVL